VEFMNIHTNTVQQETHIKNQEGNTQIDIFLHWRTKWHNAPHDALYNTTMVPENIVLGMNQLARFILFFWRKRMPMLGKCVEDESTWEECISAIRSVLLDPSLSYEYQGIPASIRYFAFASKSVLLPVVADARAVSLSDLTQEPPAPSQHASEFGDRVFFALKDWCRRGGMEQKWVALVVLRQQADWSDIARQFKCAPAGTDESQWESLRGEMELPTWAEIHAWFATPPPVIWEDARALRQFYSRFSKRFQSDLLENF
jgi:hypothetical protein